MAKGGMEEILNVEDATYAMFQSGFDEVVAQVKQFNASMPIDFSTVNRDQSLKDLEQDSSKHVECFSPLP